MGQANSRGAAGPSASRPGISQHDTTAPDAQPSALPPSRSSRQHRFSPFSRLSSDASDAGSSGSTTSLAQRTSRLHRARSTISTSLPNFFARRSFSRFRDEAQPRPASVGSPNALRRPRIPSRHTANDGQRYSLPHLQVPDLDLDFDGMGAGVEPSPSSDQARALPRREDRRAPSFISDRMSALRPDRSLRSMTSSLRRRRSPVRRDEDHAAMLSRLLSIAAAATAASLMGDDHEAVSEARSVAGDEEDGTFDSFLRSLQNGRIASALRQSTTETEEGDRPGGVPPQLNFFRMFRFGTSTGANRRNDSHTRGGDNSETSNGSPDPSSNDEEGTDGRMVPIIIVGISSISPGSGSDHVNNIPPFLDALSRFPSPLTSQGESAIDGMLRQPQNGTSFSHRRRTSLGSSNTLSGGYDNQRHHRSPHRPSVSPSLIPEMENLLAGRRPPPSTPASSGLSALSSGSATPTLSPPASSQSTPPSRRGSLLRRTTSSGLESTAEEGAPHQQRTARQRQLSEHDHTRFGSGSSRRNGVVEPDHNPGDGARSWIIYVLGGSYPENHPILTTPSLFTDSPTYEDMLLLSALLGPVKPPVASEEDVAAARGLYRIQLRPGSAEQLQQLVAVAVEGEDAVVIGAEERCLVCLCEYEIDEEARRIQRCGHLFHRECIDQWLTTGRNSCPLCRGQGVEEKSGRAEGADAAVNSVPSPAA